MSNNTVNSGLGWPLRLFMGVVLVVLITGIGLFFFPGAVVPRWPWPLAPFNTRFLGAIYASEMAVVLILLVVNRWAPARVAMPIALAFTAIVSVVSLLYLGQFNPQRRVTWIWFILYIGSAVISGWFLWYYRRLPQPAEAVPTSGWQRVWLRVESALLGIYGLGLLLAPSLFSTFWPWKIDDFHAQIYSAIFIGGAIGTFIVSRAAAYIELLAMGLAEIVFGLLAVVGLIVVDAAVHKVNWTLPGTWVWLGLFALLFVSGLLKGWQAYVGNLRVGSPVLASRQRMSIRN